MEITNAKAIIDTQSNSIVMVRCSINGVIHITADIRKERGSITAVFSKSTVQEEKYNRDLVYFLNENIIKEQEIKSFEVNRSDFNYFTFLDKIILKK